MKENFEEAKQVEEEEKRSVSFIDKPQIIEIEKTIGGPTPRKIV